MLENETIDRMNVQYTHKIFYFVNKMYLLNAFQLCWCCIMHSSHLTGLYETLDKLFFNSSV